MPDKGWEDNERDRQPTWRQWGVGWRRGGWREVGKFQKKSRR